MTSPVEQPTTEQIEALKSYAAQHGRTWKRCLLDDWMKAGSKTFRGPWNLLQEVRNQLGPTWLMKFKLPKTGK